MDLTLDNIIEYKPAEKALEKLVGAKINPKLLEVWLRAVSDSGPRMSMGSLQAQRRKVLALAKKAGILAIQIEHADDIPSKIPTMRPGHVLEMPRMLREFATGWIDAHAFLWVRYPFVSEENETITWLLGAVEKATGKPHCPEIAHLLNGVAVADWGG